MGVISIKAQQAQSLNAVGASGTVWMSNGITATPTWQSVSGGSGTVTNTGTLTANRIIKGNGGVDVTVGDLSGDVTTSGSMATTIANNAVTTANINAGAVTEAKQTLADNTTCDVSTSAHGYAPKAPNNTGKFLRGDATWATPYVVNYISGNWYFGCISTGSLTGNTTLAVDTCRAHPFLCEKDITVAKLGITVATAAGGKIRLVIWNDNGSMYPSTVVYDSGQLTADTAGVVSHTLGSTVTLTAGTVYWLGHVMDGTCKLPGYPNVTIVNPLMGYQASSTLTYSYIGYSKTSSNAFANGAPTFPASATIFNNSNLWSLTMFQV